MSKKTLGQVMHAADVALQSMPWDESWEALSERSRADYERLAAAVAAEVKERAAQEIETKGRELNASAKYDNHALHYALKYAGAVREMKP